MALLIGSTALFGAGMKDWYVGAGLIGGTGSFEYTGSAADYDSIGGIDIKFGVIRDNDNRFEFSRTAITAESGTTETKYKGTDFDYIWTANLNGDSFFLPFITAGFGSYDVETSTTTASGFAINAGVGFYLLLEYDLEIEVAVKQKNIAWEASGIDVTTKFKRNYVGIKYKF